MNKGVYVYIYMEMWGRLRSKVCAAEATITIEFFFSPLNKHVQSFPSKRDLLVSDLRGHPPVQESHRVSDKEKERITFR